MFNANCVGYNNWLHHYIPQANASSHTVQNGQYVDFGKPCTA